MSKGFGLLSSLRVTLVGVLWLALGLIADQNQWLAGYWAITPPLALLAANLAAAMLVDKRFRRKPALFGFHLCLLLLFVLPLVLLAVAELGGTLRAASGDPCFGRAGGRLGVGVAPVDGVGGARHETDEHEASLAEA